MGSLDEELTKANRQLDRVTIRVRGKKLSIRGTFPPKPGDSKPKLYEISPGKPATLAGLKQTKAIAQEIESLLIRDQFDWTPYLRGKEKPAATVGEWLARFENRHWSVTPQTPTKLNSFHKDYRLRFNHLPPDEPLTEELLKRVILERSQPGTRNRKGYTMAFTKLAEFAGIDHHLNELGKGYSSLKPIAVRELPSDGEIKAVRARIRNPAWRWIYDAIAVYGLRPHELFRCGRSGLLSCRHYWKLRMKPKLVGDWCTQCQPKIGMSLISSRCSSPTLNGRAETTISWECQFR